MSARRLTPGRPPALVKLQAFALPIERWTDSLILLGIHQKRLLVTIRLAVLVRSAPLKSRVNLRCKSKLVRSFEFCASLICWIVTIVCLILGRIG